MYCESSSTTTTRRADTKASDSARHGGQRPRQVKDLSGALIGSLVCYTGTRELLDRVDGMRFTQQGFLPLPLGNVREHPLAELYREHELLRAIRRGDFTGRCGGCEYWKLCG